MPTDLYEFHPAARISVGALGRPGQRVFLLQVTGEDDALNIKLEKQQAAALAAGIESLLEELEKAEAHAPADELEPAPLDVPDDQPIDVEVIAGHMGLGYDAAENRILLVVHELTETSEDESETGGEAEASETSAAEVRIWASPAQMRALSRQARQVVAQGQPTCPLCQRPLDPEGHFCPRRNGHSLPPEAETDDA
ncbi:MAG: DUF3090 domain-containing protein [Chloroflexota bacterium]